MASAPSGKHFAPASAPAPRGGLRSSAAAARAERTPRADRPRADRAPRAERPPRDTSPERRRLLAVAGAGLACLAGVGVLSAALLCRDPLAHLSQATVAVPRAQEATPTLSEQTYVRVTFSAVGDNLMNMPVVDAADANAGAMYDGWYDFTPMYSGVGDIVASHDLNFIDIETILGGDYLGLSGYPSFNSPSCIAEQVAAYGWNLATTATNHTLDMGVEGIANSCATWAQYPQVTVAGTYTSWEDRARVRVTECRGIRFALLAYTDYLNGIPVPEGYEYAVATADVDAMAADVARAHEVADVVIVAMSWGSENSFEPNDAQRYYAQALANLGVDLVVGFGPHVIQPIEWYQGYDEAGNPTGSQTLVVFSLGNFLSNQPYSYAEVEGCFTCTFERLGDHGPVTLTDLAWTPLVNHIDGGYHEVFKLKDYTYDLAWAHDVMSAEADPIAYAYNLTYDVIGPSGVWIDA